MPRYTFILIVLAGTLLTSCTYRMHDKKAAVAFKKVGVQIAFKDFAVNGRNIHYAEVGDGDKPTLFFIHGSPASWHCFDNYMQDTALLRCYRIIAIDRPGFGFSDFGEATTVSMQAVLVGALVTKLQNGKPFYVIGHSLGGPLATKITAQHPNEVNGLVLLAAAVEPYEEKDEYWRRALMPFNFAIPTALQTCNQEIWWFKDDVQTIPADLNHIKCPVIIFQGLDDHMVTPGNGFFAQKELVNSTSVQLFTFPGGHNDIPWTKFDEIKASLLKWR